MWKWHISNETPGISMATLDERGRREAHAALVAPDPADLVAARSKLESARRAVDTAMQNLATLQRTVTELENSRSCAMSRLDSELRASTDGRVREGAPILSSLFDARLHLVQHGVDDPQSDQDRRVVRDAGPPDEYEHPQVGAARHRLRAGDACRPGVAELDAAIRGVRDLQLDPTADLDEALAKIAAHVPTEWTYDVVRNAVKRASKSRQ